MEIIRPYTCFQIFLDFLLAIIQLADTFLDLLYFFKLSFYSELFHFLTIGFLCLNPLSQYIYANLRLCSYEGCFKIYLWYKKYGFFYEKIKITDCGYFSQITAHASEIKLILLYLLAPVVLALLFVSLLANMAYVILNWAVSMFFYIFSILFITMISTFFCILKLDLILYPACTEIVAVFYFINPKNAKTTDEKMLFTKKVCIFLQILFETIPLLVIFIINDNEMNYFAGEDLFTKVVIYLNFGLSGANFALTLSQILFLRKYVKVANSPYEKILRGSTNPNFNLSKKETEIMVIQSLDLIPEKKTSNDLIFDEKKNFN